MKSGYYDFYGNTVEYYDGDSEGYDLDAAESVPVELLMCDAEYVRPLED
jgi:hypothetical protein